MVSRPELHSILYCFQIKPTQLLHVVRALKELPIELRLRNRRCDDTSIRKNGPVFSLGVSFISFHRIHADGSPGDAPGAASGDTCRTLRSLLFIPMPRSCPSA